MILIKAWDQMPATLYPDAFHDANIRHYLYKKWGIRAQFRHFWCMLMFDYVNVEEVPDR